MAGRIDKQKKAMESLDKYTMPMAASIKLRMDGVGVALPDDERIHQVHKTPMAGRKRNGCDGIVTCPWQEEETGTG